MVSAELSSAPNTSASSEAPPPVQADASEAQDPSSAVVSTSNGGQGGLSVLVSLVVHLILLLLLAVWTVGMGTGRGPGLGIAVDSGGDGAEFEGFSIDSMDIEPAESRDVQESASLTSAVPMEKVSELLGETTPLPNTELGTSNAVREATAQSVKSSGGGSGFAETSLAGRSAANRGKMVRENGGNEQSEQAVAWALDYLARHQRNDGSWSMKYTESCEDACTPSSDGKDPYRFGATGLALMCFLGAGHTPDDEQYGQVVSKGIYFLQQNLKTNSTSGYWVDTVASAQMYEHGIATLALCEAYQMTRAKELKESCQLAVNFIIGAQYRDGGWDYHPGSPGDLSIAGWQVLALKSAAATDLIVPRETLFGIDRFIEKNQAGEFMFRYRGLKPTKSMTAIGLLLQIFRGRSKSARSIDGGVDYISKQGPSSTDMYYNYYATQAMFQIGGRFWKNWNYYMRDLLIRTQVPNGHARGSWMFEGDHSNQIGGRFYSTCMCCLILEVYYRYLPVYGEVSEDFRF